MMFSPNSDVFSMNSTDRQGGFASGKAALLAALALLCGNALAAPCDDTGTGTALERAARGLGDGQWCDFDAAEPSGFRDMIAVAPGASVSFVGWSHGAQWDPVNRLWVFHGYDYPPITAAMVVYKESTNTWNIFKGEPFAPGGNGHDYDQTAVDPETGFVYFRPRLTNDVWRAQWDNANDRYTWDKTSVSPISGGCPTQTSYEANGWAWDSNRKGIVMLSQADGGVVCFWDRQTNAWSKDADITVSGRFHQVAEWDPVNEIMWLNDYGPSTSHWKDVDGTVTQQASEPPFTLGCCGSSGASSTADPNTGKFVVTKSTSSGRPWMEYDVSTDTWSQITATMPPLGGNAETIGGPITDHGVIMYVTWNKGNPQVFLYRHSAGGTAPVRRPRPPDWE